MYDKFEYKFFCKGLLIHNFLSHLRDRMSLDEQDHKIKGDDACKDVYMQSDQSLTLLTIDQLRTLAVKYLQEKNYPMTVKCYLAAIEKGHIISMRELGFVYYLQNDYDSMKKYYLMAIDRDDGYAMYYMGRYYKEVQDHVNMQKYFLMAIEKHVSSAMNALAFYYHEKNDFPNMKKYYLMAIEHQDVSAMSNLGYYYHHDEKDNHNMMKYYMMAVESKDYMAMCNLASYYYEQKDYPNMMKYYMMALEKGSTTAMQQLGHYYKEQTDYTSMVKYYSMAVRHGVMFASDFCNCCRVCNCIPQCFAAMMDLLEHTTGELYKSIQCECVNMARDNVEMLTLLISEVAALRKTTREQADHIQELKLMPEGPEYAEAKQRFVTAASRSL